MNQTANIYGLEVYNYTAELSIDSLELIIATFILKHEKWFSVVKYIRDGSSNCDDPGVLVHVIMFNRFLTSSEAKEFINALPKSRFTTLTPISL